MPPLVRAGGVHFTTAIQLSESTGLLRVDRRESNPLSPGSHPGGSPFAFGQHESGHLDSNQDRPLIKRELYL